MKEERKAERERKRVEKELMKERKRREREEKESERASRHKGQKKNIKSQKRKRAPASDSSSDEDKNRNISYADSDPELSELEPHFGSCTACKTSDGKVCEWVECVLCDRKWHVRCTDNLVLQSLTTAELKNNEYFCDDCVFD